ncbi:hypothetical protein AB7M16_006024 [Bradyrhizobium sp. USDA 372]
MSRHPTRADLARGVAGAVSTLVLCAAASSSSRAISRYEEFGL